MQKKKYTGMILAAAVLLVVAAAIWGKQYYDSRYIGTTYYAMIPLDYDVTPEALYDMSGKQQVGTGVNVSVTGYDREGTAKALSFTAMEGREEIPQPGSYLQAEASEQLVLSWQVVAESAVPARAREKIQADG